VRLNVERNERAKGRAKECAKERAKEQEDTGGGASVMAIREPYELLILGCSCNPSDAEQ
jgi:hypothetical protein